MAVRYEIKHGAHLINISASGGVMSHNTLAASSTTPTAKFAGSTFHLVRGADPLCGHVVPGKTVAPSQ